ncbi:MAG: hypothetical protein IIA72_00515 [Proteobacteria bacterium]|nr:hypothetical protein [Pseudomonadota bacterium]
MAFNPNNLVKVFQAGNPFANDPPDANVYYAAIGRIVVLWGRFEQMLEQTISMMGQVPNAVTPQKPPPVAFMRKLDRLKELCRDTPSVNHIHDDARAFASAAAILAPRRHGLTHANWQGFNRNVSEPTVTFTNIQWNANAGGYNRHPIPLSELETLLADIAQLNANLFDKVFNEVARVLVRASHNPSEPA